MTILLKNTKFFLSKKKYQNWDFWYANIPSSNPGTDRRSKKNVGFFTKNCSPAKPADVGKNN
jgi:hypothetical protein